MFYWKLTVVSVMLVIAQCQTVKEECPNIKTNLHAIKKRRHLTFPDSSSAVITISMAKTFQTHAPSGWFMTSDMDVIYPLPDSKFTNSHFRRVLHHRQKRELWDKIKNAFYFHNMNGHYCLLRSICEAKIYLAPPGRSLIHDILRAIFTAPVNEKEFTEETEGMYDELLDPEFCDKVPDCPFSIIHFILAFNKRK